MIIINNLINYGFSKIAMQNQQRNIESKNISKLSVILLSIILLTGISFIPVLQAGVYAQQPQPQQKNRIGISQVIEQIAQQVATANPGTNPTHINQILVQLAKLTASQTSNVSKAIQTIKQIDSQVKSFPKGRVSQALIQIAKQQAAGNTTLVTQAMNQAVQYIRTGVPGANALVQVALQAAAGGTPVLNQQLRQIAQQVANGTGAQQTQILQTLQQIALKISNTEGGGRDKVVHTVKVIHDRVSKNHKDPISKSIVLIGPCFQAKGPCAGRDLTINNENYYDVTIWNEIIQTGDVNILGDVAIQAAVNSPGA